MIRRQILSTVVLSGLALLAGCRQTHDWNFHGADQVRKFKQTALDIEYPNVSGETDPVQAGLIAPKTLDDLRPEDFWDLTLEEAVQLALANSKVINDIGGRVVQAPANMNTVFDPAITESDPRTGVEAALSAFDASLASGVTWNKFDRPINSNPGFAALFAPVREADAAAASTQISKTTATGGRAAWRYNVNYDWNNSPTNLFPSAWTNAMEVEVRQPLLQGAGVEFNRINGPNSTLAGQSAGNLGAFGGFSTGGGVLLARLNTDISLTQFETATRNLVSDVENAYWDLYFAYRDLDAKIRGRDSALETWRKIEALARAGARGGEADKEAQAREQYYRFRGQVENALSGIPGASTQTGVGAGIFRGAGGVYSRENNLRFLMGLPPTDGRLIRPSDEPTGAKVTMDWGEVVSESLYRRVELRRQKWVVKSRELQLVAARNFLLPRLDTQALYRWYGFGDQYLQLNDTSNAVQSMTNGDFQEWQLGVQLQVPLGYRQAFAAVRNAELQLARERAILKDQELRVVHDLAAAVREVDRAYQLTRTNFNRRIASFHEVKAVQDAYDAGTTTLDVLLDAQRRAAEAESDYFRSLVEHSLALKGVEFEKGSLLEYNGVQLAEGRWNTKAYQDANYLAHKLTPSRLSYRFSRPYKLSQGVYDQGDTTASAAPQPAAQDLDAPPPAVPAKPEEAAPQAGANPAARGPAVHATTGENPVADDRVEPASATEPAQPAGEAAKPTAAPAPVTGPVTRSERPKLAQPGGAEPARRLQIKLD